MSPTFGKQLSPSEVGRWLTPLARCLGLLSLGLGVGSSCTSPMQSEGTVGVDGKVQESRGSDVDASHAGFPTPYPGSAPVGVEVDTEGSIEVITLPEADVTGRGRRRMDIDQLETAIKQVSNGLTWTEKASNGTETELFKTLAVTLGKPDHIQITTEDLSASLLFEKFLSDAANNVCRKLVERELTQPMTERVLMMTVEPEDTIYEAEAAVEANLRLLVSHYHSRVLEPYDLELDPWLWLFESASHVTQDPAQGWRAVCVGLLTHPDFYTY